MQTGQARAGRRAGVAAAAIWMTACLLPPGVQAAGAAGVAGDVEKRGANERDGRNERPPSLPQVVVTVGKREQRLERFNGAAAVAGEGALRDAGVNDTLALARALPGLYTSYGANVMFPIITLLGMTSSQDFYNPALTVYVDGVPQLPVFAAQALAGVERVELLKGPQGTLYGKSALGGVLNVRTRTPGDAPYFSLRGTLSGRGARAGRVPQLPHAPL